MAETEVESILREIRERVVSEQRAGQNSSHNPRASTALAPGTNGSAQQGLREAATPQTLALISSYLTTTSRAWDRLPPVVSNRSGLSARIELWIKRRLRAATHWFTWEQVNFNAAVHHALRDLLPILSAHEQRALTHEERASAHEQQLRMLQAKIEAEGEARGTQLKQYSPRVELDSRLASLVSELRERDAHGQDQQRVCFKQLSLETSEAAVLEDRARRKTEVLLEELTRRVDQLGKDKK